MIWKRQAGREVTREDAIEMLRTGEFRQSTGAVGGADRPLPRPRAAVATSSSGQRSFGCTSWKSKKSPGCGYVIFKTPRGLGARSAARRPRTLSPAG